MQFEFSRLERGSFVPPHTDDPKKLISLLLYFPDPKWQENYGGGTEFYRTKKRAMDNNWANREVQFKDLNPFFRAQFAPNRLVGFLKSNNSYHGVQPITCPEGMARNSLNINVNRILRATRMPNSRNLISRANAKLMRYLSRSKRDDS